MGVLCAFLFMLFLKSKNEYINLLSFFKEKESLESEDQEHKIQENNVDKSQNYNAINDRDSHEEIKQVTEKDSSLLTQQESSNPRRPSDNKKSELTKINFGFLKIFINCFSILIYFFFIFLRGNALLKSFANIQ